MDLYSYLSILVIYVVIYSVFNWKKLLSMASNGTGKSGILMSTKTEKSKTQSFHMDFSHPEFKKISLKNGEINQMNKDEILHQLTKLQMETRGNKEVLKKRLKNYYRKLKLFKSNIKCDHMFFDYLCIIDFEATCESSNPPSYPYEIIEFPAVLVNTLTLQIEDHFQSYCRPFHHPKLSTFCTSLTGITQHMVDQAEPFPIVLNQFQEWLDTHQLGSKYSFAVVTDGPWDMAKFLVMQSYLTKVPVPSYGKKWINLRKTYCNYYGYKRTKLSHMLECLGMQFEGRPHCGLDDARNIARIVLQMLKDGCEIRINEKLKKSSSPFSDDCLVEPVSRQEFLREFDINDDKKEEDIDF